jgi:hypothetical protein
VTGGNLRPFKAERKPIQVQASVVVPVRLPGAVLAGYRRGDHLAPDYAVGRVTFEEFLAERFGGASADHGPG